MTLLTVVACEPVVATGPTEPVVVVAATPFAVGTVMASTQPQPHWTEPPALEWSDDLARARAAARSQGRRILVYGHADWAADSIAFQRIVWADRLVRRAATGMVLVLIDITQDEKSLRELEALGVHGVPAVVVLAPDGEVVARREGGASPAIIREWLDGVNSR